MDTKLQTFVGLLEPEDQLKFVQALEHYEYDLDKFIVYQIDDIMRMISLSPYIKYKVFYKVSFTTRWAYLNNAITISYDYLKNEYTGKQTFSSYWNWITNRAHFKTIYILYNDSHTFERTLVKGPTESLDKKNK